MTKKIRKRFMAMLLACSMVMGSCQTSVYAGETELAAASEEAVVAEEEMKAAEEEAARIPAEEEAAAQKAAEEEAARLAAEEEAARKAAEDSAVSGEDTAQNAQDSSAAKDTEGDLAQIVETEETVEAGTQIQAEFESEQAAESLIEDVSETETESVSESWHITMTAVTGEENTQISEKYTGIDAPAFEDVLDLSSSPLEEDVTQVQQVEGTNRLYLINYGYDYATVDGERMDSLSKKSVTKDTEILLHYSTSETKRQYVYEDDAIRVTATVQDPAALPDDAVFEVGQIKNGPIYNAYLEALNANSEALGVYPGPVEMTDFRPDNTLLYDLSFMVQKADEDGNPVPGERVEIEPESGTVRIQFAFKNRQLKKEIGMKEAEDITLAHLPLADNLLETVDRTSDVSHIDSSDVIVEPIDMEQTTKRLDRVTFSLDGLSIISISSNPDKFGDTDQTNSQVNFSLALGRAVEYGIVADTYDQKNHQQTNFAVKTFKNTGGINGEPDLAGTWDVPYQVGEVTMNKLRFGTNTYQSQAVQYDVYLPKAYEADVNNHVQVDGGGKNTVNFIYEDGDTIKNNITSMISGAAAKSNLMASHPTTIDLTNDVVTDQNQLVVDTTSYPDNAVIYLNVPEGSDYSMIRTVLGMQASFHIHKNPGQVIVVNILGSAPVSLSKMIVTLPGEDKNTKDDRFSTFSPSGQNSSINGILPRVYS